MMVDYKYAMGKPLKYYDYLDLERFGKVAGIEPRSDELAWIYIEDEETEMNIHTTIIDGKEIKYAEMRSSDEVYLDIE